MSAPVLAAPARPAAWPLQLGLPRQAQPAGHSYRCCRDTDYAGYLGYIRQLPLAAEPEVFGLHGNADITKDQQEADMVLASCLAMQGELRPTHAEPHLRCFGTGSVHRGDGLDGRHRWPSAQWRSRWLSCRAVLRPFASASTQAPPGGAGPPASWAPTRHGSRSLHALPTQHSMRRG